MTTVKAEGFRQSYTRLAPSEGHPFVSSQAIPRLASIGRLRRPTSISGAEVPSVEIQLDNADGGITESLKWADGRFACLPAIINDQLDVLIEGRIEQTLQGVAPRLRLVAGDLLSAVPLRSASLLGSFDQDDVLPRIIGSEVSAPAPAISSDRRQRFVCDAPLAENSVLSVTVGTELLPPGGGWQQYPELIDGRLVTTVILAQAPEDGQAVSVVVNGEPNPTNGRSIENPGDVMTWLLNELFEEPGPNAGRWQADELRRWSSENGLRIRGVIDGSANSRRALLQQIAVSAGALWSLGMPDLARPWPLPDLADRYVRGTVTPLDDTVPTGNPESRFNIYEVRFDYDWATDQYRQSFLATHRASVERYEPRPASNSIDLPWVGIGRVAEFIAKRYVQYQADPPPIVTFDYSGIDHNPGDIWRVDHNIICEIGPGLAIEAGLELAQHRAEIQVAFPPRPGVVAVSARAQRLVFQDAVIQFDRNADSITIVATRQDGTKLPGATVTLGGQQVVANSVAEATFSNISPGTYEIQIKPLDGDVIPSSITIPS